MWFPATTAQAHLPNGTDGPARSIRPARPSQQTPYPHQTRPHDKGVRCDHPPTIFPASLPVRSPATATTSRTAERPSVGRRPTPYESGLAAVARRDVHIERVWPMRSPPTGSLEESSSAYFQRERRGTPPASIVPVGGLRMSQAFEHQPVMTAEVVDLFSPVPPGLIVDATLGGGGHAGRPSPAHPAIIHPGYRPRSPGRGGGHRGAGPLRGPGRRPPVRASTPWARWSATSTTNSGLPTDRRG